ASEEMPDGWHFAAERDGRTVPVEAHGPGNDVDKRLLALCEKSARGGGLGKQVEETARRAGEVPVVLVRSTPFPKDPKAVVARRIANLVAPVGKGRRVEVQNADWRAMAAFRRFCAEAKADPQFTPWQMQARPLTSLAALRVVLDLDRRLGR